MLVFGGEGEVRSMLLKLTISKWPVFRRPRKLTIETSDYSKDMFMFYLHPIQRQFLRNLRSGNSDSRSDVGKINPGLDGRIGTLASCDFEAVNDHEK